MRHLRISTSTKIERLAKRSSDVATADAEPPQYREILPTCLKDMEYVYLATHIDGDTIDRRLHSECNTSFNVPATGCGDLYILRRVSSVYFDAYLNL